MQGILWRHKRKAERFCLSWLSKREVVTPGKFQNSHLCEDPCKIYSLFEFSGFGDVWRNPGFPLFHHVIQFSSWKPCPHLWSWVSRMTPQMENHFRVKCTFWRKMNSTLQTWFFSGFSIKRNIKPPEYFKAELPNFSWLPIRNSASLSHESAQPGYKFNKMQFLFC